MQICPQCGQPIDDDHVKCPMCNQPVSTDEPEITETDVTKINPTVTERPLVTLLKKLLKQKKFWLITAYVLAGLLTLFWGGRIIGKMLTPKKAAASSMMVEAGLKQQLETMIDEILPEKLEWGQELLKLRLPSRFPDELVLDTNKALAEVKYQKAERNTAYYEFPICYHFEDDVEDTFHWKMVTYYFELRDGKWMMIGEKWISEADLELE